MTAPRFVEMYYSIGQVALAFQMSERWVRDRVNAGDFGCGVLDLNGDIRIPASGLNEYAAAHTRVYSEPIKARNRGELLRKVRAADGSEEVQASGPG